MQRISGGRYLIAGLYVARLIDNYPKKRIYWGVYRERDSQGGLSNLLTEFRTLKDARKAILKDKLDS